LAVPHELPQLHHAALAAARLKRRGAAMSLGDAAPPRKVNLDGLSQLAWSFGAAKPGVA